MYFGENVLSMKALITTVPFGERDRTTLDRLEDAGIEYLINPTGRKLTEPELAEMAADFDVLIAGTEPIGRLVMDNAPRLKMISRVGIGLDSVDLLAAKDRGIVVSYTPDAPAPAVAELTVGLMITLLRSVQTSNLQMHDGKWHRYFGMRLSNATIGIIGAGRIGSKVIHHLAGFDVSRVLINDRNPKINLDPSVPVTWADKETIYREADIISFHLPLTSETKDLVRKEQLAMMKDDALILNTARGGIINEQDLFESLNSGHLGGAAIDVFKHEPYGGPLTQIDRCVLTAHMGSMSVDCRIQMEVEATEEAIRFMRKETLLSEVPQDEYDVQSQGI